MTALPDLGLEGEPGLAFQPAVDLATGRLLGFEALLRWHDPETGMVPPNVIIPFAEASGAMTALNAWVLTEACTQAAGWGSNVQLAVNCSVFQLRKHEAAEAAAAAIEESGLNPDRLTIEITELALSDNTASADLQAISRLGIQLTVDDIGSDWSALENLEEISINTMKIDRDLVAKLEGPEAEETLATVRSIVEASRSLGLCIVAEGVETSGQADILRQLGVDVAQGYFFARPLSPEDARALTLTAPLPIFPQRAPATQVQQAAPAPAPAPPPPPAAAHQGGFPATRTPAQPVRAAGAGAPSAAEILQAINEASFSQEVAPHIVTEDIVLVTSSKRRRGR